MAVKVGLQLADVNAALEEILFTGGSLSALRQPRPPYLPLALMPVTGERAVEELAEVIPEASANGS